MISEITVASPHHKTTYLYDSDKCLINSIIKHQGDVNSQMDFDHMCYFYADPFVYSLLVQNSPYLDPSDLCIHMKSSILQHRNYLAQYHGEFSDDSK